MDINAIQQKIDSTEYYDAEVLDFEIKYFGDEVRMVYEDDDETSWVVRFLTCLKVQYETDADWRRLPYVKEMARTQLAHFLQKMSIELSDEHPEYMEIKIDTTLLLVEIICREIAFEKVDNSTLTFFWQGNKVRRPDNN